MSDQITLGQKIKILRIARGLSQGDLAKAVGVRQPSLSEFETGKALPCDDTLQRIKAALRWPDEDQARVAFYILAGDGDGN